MFGGQGEADGVSWSDLRCEARIDLQCHKLGNLGGGETYSRH